jgi:hypothetical protein
MEEQLSPKKKRLQDIANSKNNSEKSTEEAQDNIFGESEEKKAFPFFSFLMILFFFILLTSLLLYLWDEKHDYPKTSIPSNEKELLAEVLKCNPEIPSYWYSLPVSTHEKMQEMLMRFRFFNKTSRPIALKSLQFLFEHKLITNYDFIFRELNLLAPRELEDHFDFLDRHFGLSFFFAALKSSSAVQKYAQKSIKEAEVEWRNFLLRGIRSSSFDTYKEEMVGVILRYWKLSTRLAAIENLLYWSEGIHLTEDYLALEHKDYALSLAFLLALETPESISILLKNIKNPNTFIAKSFKNVLEHLSLNPKKSEEGFLSALRHSDPSLRTLCLEFLSNHPIDSPLLFDEMLKCLESEASGSLQGDAIQALLKIQKEKHPLLLPLLMKKMNDPHWYVSYQALYGLGLLGSLASSAIPLVISAIENREWEVQLRAEQLSYSVFAMHYADMAVWVLGEIGTEREILSVLLSALSHENFKIRLQALKALGRIKASAPEVGRHIVEAFQREESLEKSLSDSLLPFSSTAFESLKQIASAAQEEAFLCLTQGLSTASPSFLKESLNALTALGRSTASLENQLVSLILTYPQNYPTHSSVSTEEQEETQARALNALRSLLRFIEIQTLMPFFLEALEKKGVPLRIEVLKTISTFKLQVSCWDFLLRDVSQEPEELAVASMEVIGILQQTHPQLFTLFSSILKEKESTTNSPLETVSALMNSKNLKIATLKALKAHLNGTQAIPLIFPYLNPSHFFDLRMTAIKTLSVYGSDAKEVRLRLLQFAKEGSSEPQEFVEACREALKNIK